MAQKISVVIVSYNVCQLLDECLQSVERALDGVDADIFVVDNRSTDHTVKMLRPKHPQVHFIANPKNVGFARANNQAIRRSDAEYVLLLNPDTVVYEPTIKGCLEFMDQHPEAGGAGVRMLTRESKPAPESRRAIPTPWISMLKMLGFTKRYYMSNLPWDKPSQIEVVSGAYCLLRRKALDQVGLLDEVHYKGESTEKTSFRYVHVFYDAMLIFFRKHYGHLSILLSLPIKTAIYFRAFLALMQMLSQQLRNFLHPQNDIKA